MHKHIKPDNAKIKIIGIQDDVDSEPIELYTTGKWLIKNGKDYIFYVDKILNSDAETNTRIIFDGLGVSILRTGGLDTHLIFEKGVRHFIPYETPFGILDMTSYTEDIFSVRRENSLEIRIIYHLEMDQSNLGRNVFHIIIESL
ncbi:MAG: DUF1934 domain-containing protein [Vallitaleaceae bacterium]|nr:DUF1934 domain-containing protein [Vallitaleaceae bacterium]